MYHKTMTVQVIYSPCSVTVPEGRTLYMESRFAADTADFLTKVVGKWLGNGDFYFESYLERDNSMWVMVTVGPKHTSLVILRITCIKVAETKD